MDYVLCMASKNRCRRGRTQKQNDTLIAWHYTCFCSLLMFTHTIIDGAVTMSKKIYPLTKRPIWIDVSLSCVRPIMMSHFRKHFNCLTIGYNSFVRITSTPNIPLGLSQVCGTAAAMRWHNSYTQFMWYENMYRDAYSLRQFFVVYKCVRAWRFVFFPSIIEMNINRSAQPCDRHHGAQAFWFDD